MTKVENQNDESGSNLILSFIGPPELRGNDHLPHANVFIILSEFSKSMERVNCESSFLPILEDDDCIILQY